jgi:hypothetical protein
MTKHSVAVTLTYHTTVWFEVEGANKEEAEALAYATAFEIPVNDAGEDLEQWLPGRVKVEDIDADNESTEDT